ncbi:hypothetical protein [Nostoc sp. LPT]|uniref:hypothetical protein n=1 Tax=Nostoc sp. LPT TaxID=2815387 RepID=UPI001D312A77|nr:hypothetical protein [Nostoc sp. LPT]MBN4005365.1 hypothetical protein [Nostoc sp. LPT]
MKQQNNQEVTKQELQKFYWPLWFPYPSSWLKAFILTLFLRVIIFVIKNTGKVGYDIVYFVHSPELFFIFTILLILSPIPIISLTHHCLHLLISRFASETQAPEIGRTQGLLPGIMSWWEGLYAWLIIAISTLIVLIKTDTFREAVSKAINAANLTQSAKSLDEWKTVVSQWEAAIALMKAVPSSSPNYVVAQQKTKEYQRNLNYAQKNSLGNK